jgi:hypothetical protein
MTRTREDSMRPDLEELRRLHEAATPGPWEARDNRSGNPTVGQVGRAGNVTPWIADLDDARFIAAARNALPWLLDEIAALHFGRKLVPGRFRPFPADSRRRCRQPSRHLKQGIGANMTAEDLLSDYITRTQLAIALKVAERTISRYENQPDGLPSTTIGGRRYYRLPAVKAWLEARERRPNPRRHKAKTEAVHGRAS